MTSTSGTNATAMSLWQRFTEMQAAVDESRRQREAVTEETHRIQQEVSTLQDCQLKDQAAQDQARRDYDTLTTELATWQVRLAQAQQENSQASREKQEVQQQMDRWKQTQTEQRETFLEESRLFRSKCKKMRLTASAMGLSHAGSAAYAAVREGPEASLVYHGLDNNDESWQSESGKDSAQEREDDPSSWHVDPDDHEMKDRVATYLDTKKNIYEVARKALEDAKQEKLVMAEKCASREQNRQKLKAQIDRLSKDNEDLETQIREVEQLTEEANLMAEAFEKKLKQSTSTLQSSTVTPSPVPRNTSHRTLTNDNQHTTNPSHSRAHNPYAKSSNHSASFAGTATNTNGSAAESRVHASLANDPRRDQIRAIALGQHAPSRGLSTTSEMVHTTSPLEMQHPHRATGRRFRRDKQFGCSLQIGGGQEYRHVEDTAGDSLQVDAAPDVATPVIRHASHAVDFEEEQDDDDDDDDDALLSYVAFQK